MSKLKEGGWAVHSGGKVQSGDVIAAVAGRNVAKMDVNNISRLLQVIMWSWTW